MALDSSLRSSFHTAYSVLYAWFPGVGSKSMSETNWLSWKCTTPALALVLQPSNVTRLSLRVYWQGRSPLASPNANVWVTTPVVGTSPPLASNTIPHQFSSHSARSVTTEPDLAVRLEKVALFSNEVPLSRFHLTKV